MVFNIFFAFDSQGAAMTKALEFAMRGIRTSPCARATRYSNDSVLVRSAPPRILRAVSTMLFVALVALVSGCEGDTGTNPVLAAGGQAGAPAPGGGTTTPGGGTTDPGGGTTDPGGGAPDASSIIPTWYGVQANILQRFCTICHSGSAPPAGLSWEVTQYDNIVTGGRASTEIPGMLEVNPGDPDASYVMWKLRGQGPAGQAIVGVRMPATGIPLDPALIAVVEQWIRAGAPLGVPADATAGGGPTGPVYPVGSWMYVWTEALTVCTLCHSRTPSSERCGRDFSCPPKGVVLTSDNYNGVVNGGEVEPGRLDNSKMWQRVTDNDPDKRMPFGLPALSQTQLDIIRNWINDGAPFCPAGAVCPP